MMNWTKVTPETLPPEGEDVIATMLDGDGRKFTRAGVSFDRRQGWVWTYGEDEIPISRFNCKVTHWTPMPAPAEDE